jgi:hypothetical protein
VKEIWRRHISIIAQSPILVLSLTAVDVSLPMKRICADVTGIARGTAQSSQILSDSLSSRPAIEGRLGGQNLPFIFLVSALRGTGLKKDLICMESVPPFLS